MPLGGSASIFGADSRAAILSTWMHSFELCRELKVRFQSVLAERIVRLIDVFEVSKDGFCTVLEYCDGGDLEQVNT